MIRNAEQFDSVIAADERIECGDNVVAAYDVLTMVACRTETQR